MTARRSLLKRAAQGDGKVTLNTSKQTFGGGVQDSTFTVTGAITIAPTDTGKTGITGETTADILSLGTGAVLAIAASNTLTVGAATLDVGEGSITLAADSSIIKLAKGTATSGDATVLQVASGHTLTSGYTGHISAVGAGFVSGDGGGSDDLKTNIGVANANYTEASDNMSTKVYSVTDLTPGGTVAKFISITVGGDGETTITPKESTSTISKTSKLVVGNT